MKRLSIRDKLPEFWRRNLDYGARDKRQHRRRKRKEPPNGERRIGRIQS